ncbi:hypothetical protein [Spiroplasma poulsonii]|nr:hypothetical protein [Spiroplasma poulsonii]
MKSLLQIFTTITVVGASAASVVACGKKYLFDSSIWVITDGGTTSDLAFNQLT